MEQLYINNEPVESRYAPLAGYSYTRSGYGRRIPTTIMVRYHGRWRRVYCCIYSNVGTCYLLPWVVVS